MEVTDKLLSIYNTRYRGVFYSLYPLWPNENRDAGNIRELTHFQTVLAGPKASDENAHIYIHIPFCDSFCSFCAIPKRIAKPDLVDDFLDALKQEISMYSDKPYVQSCKFRSLYLGGGTPSVLTLEQLSWLLDYCFDHLPIEKDAEITVEGSTHNFSEEKLEIVLEKGANRVSFGIQSFNDPVRQILDLQDDAQAAIFALKSARKAGFDTIDIDLMYSLPGQTLADVEEDFHIAADLGLENISFYPLHVGKGTRLYNRIQAGAIPLGSLKLEVRMYLKAVETAKAAGYEQQSILSKWILPDKLCLAEKHRMGPYDCLALGPSGNGNLGDYVYRNVSSLQDYLALIKEGGYPMGCGQKILAEENIRRYMCRAFSFLKMDKIEFEQRFSMSPEQAFPEEISFLQRQGFIAIDNKEIRLTPVGEIWGQNVCVEFCSKPWKERLLPEETNQKAQPQHSCKAQR